jgi:hypothetical protein
MDPLDREPRIPRRPPNARQPTQAPVAKPGPRPVVWGSLSLFVVLFAFLTFQLSASAAPSTARGAHDKKVATRQRAAAEAEAATDAELSEEAEAESQYAEPEYAETEYAETESGETEYVEPEPEPEVEYVEPEVEETPPVITSSS